MHEIIRVASYIKGNTVVKKSCIPLHDQLAQKILHRIASHIKGNTVVRTNLRMHQRKQKLFYWQCPDPHFSLFAIFAEILYWLYDWPEYEMPNKKPQLPSRLAE